MKKLITLPILLYVTSFFGQVPASSPLFINSVVSTTIDFIMTTDPDAFVSITYVGRFDKEMPDSRNDNLLDKQTYVYKAKFSNNKVVEIWCHSSFGSQTASKGYADKLCPRLGKLPALMRDKLSHVVIHKGNAGAFAEAEGNFFVLYSDNMDVRISNNDLEETVFHESVHASLDLTHSATVAWKKAQTDDVNFITNYAMDNPNLEDLAETTLFAYTMILYPGRLSANIETWAKTHIPNRLNYIKTKIFPNLVPVALEESVQDAALELKAYPNPSNGQIAIWVDYIEPNGRLFIMTSTGKLVKTVECIKGQNKLDLIDLPKGVYFATLLGYSSSKIILF
jgi:hypothetical protein